MKMKSVYETVNSYLDQASPQQFPTMISQACADQCEQNLPLIKSEYEHFWLKMLKWNASQHET